MLVILNIGYRLPDDTNMEEYLQGTRNFLTNNGYGGYSSMDCVLGVREDSVISYSESVLRVELKDTFSRSIIETAVRYPLENNAIADGLCSIGVLVTPNRVDTVFKCVDRVYKRQSLIGEYYGLSMKDMGIYSLLSDKDIQEIYTTFSLEGISKVLRAGKILSLQNYHDDYLLSFNMFKSSLGSKIINAYLDDVFYYLYGR